MMRTTPVAYTVIVALVVTGVAAAGFTAGAQNEVAGSSTNPEAATTTITMTRTLPNGSTIVSTSVTVGTGTGCTGESCEGMPPVALESVAITRAYAGATTKTVVFEVKNVGTDNVTLAGANVTIYSTNAGYRGSVVLSLQGIRLGRGLATDVTTPMIPYLAAGDKVDIKVWTTVGTFATDTVTASS